MSLQVHLQTAPDAPLEPLLEHGISLTVGPDLPSPAQYELLVAGRPTAEALTASPALRTVVIPFAGLPAVTARLLQDYPALAIHNLHHNAAATAEMAVALLLATARQLAPIDRAFRQDGWQPDLRRPGIQLAGKTVLILGYGAIGQRVARACVALQMQVLALRRNATLVPVEPEIQIHPPEQLHALLPRAAALIVCLPATPETEGLLGAAELALLPPGALLVNVGRAAVIDEQALFDALGNHLGGAGLDVWYQYGAGRPARLPFETLDNLLMSPHRGGTTDASEADRMRSLALLLNQAAAGRPLPDRLNLSAGY